MANLLVFGVVPVDAKLVGDLVDVIEVISKVLVFNRAGQIIGEVKTGETTVFIQLLKCTIIEDVTSVPDVVSMLVFTSDRWSLTQPESVPILCECIMFQLKMKS